jgi:hypothetical protein
VAISCCQGLCSAARLIIIRRYLRAKFGRRFTRKSFEDAIELRERLKARGERDFTDAQFGVTQKITRICEPDARDILDEIYAGYLLEIFTQVIGVHVNDVCDFG